LTSIFLIHEAVKKEEGGKRARNWDQNARFKKRDVAGLEEGKRKKGAEVFGLGSVYSVSYGPGTRNWSTIITKFSTVP